jgi:hypothetical protein
MDVARRMGLQARTPAWSATAMVHRTPARPTTTLRSRRRESRVFRARGSCCVARGPACKCAEWIPQPCPWTLAPSRRPFFLRRGSQPLTAQTPDGFASMALACRRAHHYLAAARAVVYLVAVGQQAREACWEAPSQMLAPSSRLRGAPRLEPSVAPDQFWRSVTRMRRTPAIGGTRSSTARTGAELAPLHSRGQQDPRNVPVGVWMGPSIAAIIRRGSSSAREIAGPSAPTPSAFAVQPSTAGQARSDARTRQRPDIVTKTGIGLMTNLV